MENRAHAFLAGLFVIALGAALLFVLWWFSSGREDMRSYELYSRGNVIGLNLQAQVRYRGMQAGRVEDILVDPADPRNILVRIEVRADLPLTMGTRASLATQGVTGLAFVLLEDGGTDRRPLEGVGGELPRIALQPSTFEKIASSTLETMQRFQTLAGQLDRLMNAENLQRMQNTLAHLESASVGLDRTMKQAPATLAAIRTLLSADNLASLHATLQNLAAASGEAAPTVAEFRQLLSRLDAASQRLDGVLDNTGTHLNQETLPRLDALMGEVGDVSRRLGGLMNELQQSPQLLLTGRERQAPGPGEAGFEQREKP